MNIAVVNPFDPLPGEGFRPGRYAALCRCLAEAGHDVTWYTSTFWHEFKRPRDTGAVRAAAEALGYRVVFGQAPGYRRNVSVARLHDHAVLTRRLRRLWREGDHRPEVVLASLPPPGLVRAAAEWADRVGARLVVDVQDLWPETFRRFWPPGFGWLHPVVFAGTARAAREAYRRASAVTAAARGYLEHAQPFLAPATPAEVLHLGVDLAAFDAGVTPLAAFDLVKPAGRKWVFLGGAIRSYIDVPGLVAMMAVLRDRGRDDVDLVVVAPPPSDEPVRRQMARRRVTNVLLLGYRPYDQYASIAAACDAAVLPHRPEALVFFPNRVFDYFAAGLPVLNTAAGEVADVLAEHDAGLTCVAPDPGAWADALERLLARNLPADHRARRGAWVERFDRTAISRRFVALLERVAEAPATDKRPGRDLP